MWFELCVLWDAIRFTVIKSWDQYRVERKKKETRNRDLTRMLEMV